MISIINLILIYLIFSYILNLNYLIKYNLFSFNQQYFKIFMINFELIY